MDNDTTAGPVKQAERAANEARRSQSPYSTFLAGAGRGADDRKVRAAVTKILPLALMVISGFAPFEANAASKLKASASSEYNAVGWQFYGNNGAAPPRPNCIACSKNIGI